MRTKLVVAAMAVTFSLALASCKGNKTANTATESDSVRVEIVEAAASCNSSETCCQGDSVCAETCNNKEACKENCNAACKEKCDQAACKGNCDQTACKGECDQTACKEKCEKNANCESKKECCKDKSACDKK